MTDFFAAVVRLWTPLGLAALAGVVSERAGIVNLALEAKLLAGAYAAVSVTLATGQVAVGALAGIAAGGAVGLLHVILVLFARVPAVLSGVGLNLGVLGLTTFLLRTHPGSELSTPARLPGEVGIPVAFLLVVATWLALSQTALGLRLRACGEKPEAVRSAGLSPERLRLGAVTVAGALGGLGGTLLALMGLGEFSENMTAGRGYIALAAVILGRWTPIGATLASLAFACSDALVGTLQNAGLSKAFPPDLLQIVPYLAALVALSLTRNRRQAPQALST